jgi:hypothetical protein
MHNPYLYHYHESIKIGEFMNSFTASVMIYVSVPFCKIFAYNNINGDYNITVIITTTTTK